MKAKIEMFAMALLVTGTCTCLAGDEAGEMHLPAESDKIEFPGVPMSSNASPTGVAMPMDGAIYEPRVDFEEGVFDAEEEIRKGEETIWVLAYEEKPPAKDPDTGLPIKYIVVDPEEPWHKQCMKERIRGHNNHIMLSIADKHGEDEDEKPKDADQE